MRKSLPKVHIGLRTLKTTAAIVIAMIVVDAYGASASKLIFAMLGAMAAVQPTFKESVDSCLAQIVGVLFGALSSIVLLMLPVPPLMATGIGMILVITLYNMLRIRYSPSLPCLIVVMMCTGSGIVPLAYASERIWDTAIGLSVGMLINTLVFPYDNSRQIRDTVQSLDKELIAFLEEMFDGDDILPDADVMSRKVDDMYRQMRLFSNQKLLLGLRRQQEKQETFKQCERKVRELLARMEVLSQMGRPGRLSEENRHALESSGAVIRDQRPLDSVMERDVVTNYHIRQVLRLRRELLDALKKTE
ncbi:MAG: FUSC family protein [Oscillospiraceae bacterium]|nr:FUSC family protein [Oscillospiraceae bacterium]